MFLGRRALADWSTRPHGRKRRYFTGIESVEDDGGGPARLKKPHGAGLREAVARSPAKGALSRKASCKNDDLISERGRVAPKLM